MVARMQARNDHAVAVFGEERCGETLVAAFASALIRIEAYGVDGLHAPPQTFFD